MGAISCCFFLSIDNGSILTQYASFQRFCNQCHSAKADTILSYTRDVNSFGKSICPILSRLLAQRGEEEALQANGIMSLGIIADLTREIAVNAAYISSEFKIPMADSIVLATARANNATLWTQDDDFEGIDGVRHIQKKL